MIEREVKKFGNSYHVIVSSKEVKKGDRVMIIVKKGDGKDVSFTRLIEEEVLKIISNKTILNHLKNQMQDDINRFLEDRFSSLYTRMGGEY